MSDAPVTTAVRVAVAGDEAELAADALWQAGAAAIEVLPGALVAATVDGGDPTLLLAAVAGRWPAEAIAVDLGSALDAWRQHARAVAIGDRLVVRPPWIEAADLVPHGDRPTEGRRDVVIDPGRAFGHGGHPTTRLVLRALVDLVRGNERVLDVGCGSGVLAVAALALGARSAVGVDVDRAAVAATRANAARNGVADRLVAVIAGPAAPEDTAVHDDVEVAVAAPEPAAGGYDLVVANMLASQLVAVAPTVMRAVAPGGTVVLSGLLVGQRDLVLAAYAARDESAPAEVVVVGEQEDDGWLCLTLRAG